MPWARQRLKREKLRSCCLDTVEDNALVSLPASHFLISSTQHSTSFTIYLYISIMTDIAKHTPPPTPSTQPPWMMTPPRSAEKLMRALSIDPFTSNDTPTTTNNNNDDGADYFTYLQRITCPSYRDPPLPSGPPPDPEPLFIEDEEDDDIQMGTDNRMVSHSPAALTCRSYSNLKISLLLPVP